MWFERFVIVVSSLANDFLPSSWDYFRPTFWDFTTLIGSFGLFFTLFCLFVRYLPSVAMTEAKAVMAIASPHYHHAGKSQRGASTSGHGQSGVMDSAHDDDEQPVKSEASVPGAKKVVVSGIESITPVKATADPKDLDDDGPTKVERRQEMPVVPKAEAKSESVAPKLEAPKLEAPKLEVPKLEVPKLEVPNLEAPKVEAPPSELEVPKLEVPKFEPPKLEPPPKVEAPKIEPPPKVEPPDAEKKAEEAPEKPADDKKAEDE
jgi:hypothetical protein